LEEATFFGAENSEVPSSWPRSAVAVTVCPTDTDADGEKVRSRAGCSR
jgi:hypothetical protein